MREAGPLPPGTQRGLQLCRQSGFDVYILETPDLDSVVLPGQIRLRCDRRLERAR